MRLSNVLFGGQYPLFGTHIREAIQVLRGKDMSFSKHMETKIIRTKYIVGFYEGTSAKSMVDDLLQMPPEAKLIEVREPTTREGEYRQGGSYTLTFECEKPIKEGADV